MKKIVKITHKQTDSLASTQEKILSSIKPWEHSRFVVILANLDKRSVNQNAFYWLIVKHI